MGYKRLDYLKRCKIQALWKVGYSQQKIADEVGVHKSTISRQLNHNITFVRTRLGYWEYKADYAQSFAEQRKKEKPKFIKFTDSIKAFVIEKFNKNGVQSRYVVMLNVAQSLF